MCASSTSPRQLGDKRREDVRKKSPFLYLNIMMISLNFIFYSEDKYILKKFGGVKFCLLLYDCFVQMLLTNK